MSSKLIDLCSIFKQDFNTLIIALFRCDGERSLAVQNILFIYVDPRSCYKQFNAFYEPIFNSFSEHITICRSTVFKQDFDAFSVS